MNLTSEQVLQNGISAHKKGKIQEAERLYRIILQAQPSHPDANHNLGLLLVSVNKTDAALLLFKTALEANPKIEQFWLSYINALIKEEQFEGAKQFLEEAKNNGLTGEKFNILETRLTPTPESEESKLVPQKKKNKNSKEAKPPQVQINNLIKIYQNGNLDEAEKLATSLTKEFPKHQFGWKVLGAIFQQTGRINDSLVASQKSVQIAPKDADAYNNLGNILRGMGELEEAVISYKKSIALKDHSAQVYSNLGITLHDLGKYNEAETILKQSIEIKSDYSLAHSNLGASFYEMGRYEEAESSFRQALTLKPDCIKTNSNMGLLLNAMGLMESALKYFEKGFQLKRGSNPINLYDKSFRNISKAKIDHDIEQFEYLASLGNDSKRFQELANLYKTVSLEISCTLDTDILPISDKHSNLLGGTYNRSINIIELPALDETAIGESIDARKTTENYLEHEFGLTYIDEFLSNAALKSLQDFFLRSTIWFDLSHVGGYMGAYLEDGLASPLMLQVAEELRKKLPKIFKKHRLTHLWAYKYDSRACEKNTSFTGIKAHADFAAVNVNFWITPKSANLDPSSGGLIVYNTEAPLDWDYRAYNTNQEKIYKEIQKSNQKKTIVPYNENRAVIFNSNLFHETDKINFKEGYENRRINVTMLFGKRGS